MAERRRAFGRALRVSEHLDTSKVRHLLEAEERPDLRIGPTRTAGPVRSPKPDRQAAWNRKQVDQT
jgi:hypothetical protein